MKRTFFISAVALGIPLLLTGCHVPFVPPSPAQTTGYVSSVQGAVDASTSLQNLMFAEVQGAQKNKIAFSQLYSDLHQEKNMQKNLYAQIEASTPPTGDEEIKKTLLNLIYQRVNQTDKALHVVQENNMSSLLILLKEMQSVDQNEMTSSLNNVNQVLKQAGAKKMTKI